jgi:hypothetical protein
MEHVSAEPYGRRRVFGDASGRELTNEHGADFARPHVLQDGRLDDK